MGDRLAAADQQQQPQQDDLMSSYQERIVADRVQAEKMERQQTVKKGNLKSVSQSVVYSIHPLLAN